MIDTEADGYRQSGVSKTHVSDRGRERYQEKIAYCLVARSQNRLIQALQIALDMWLEPIVNVENVISHGARDLVQARKKTMRLAR